jgi:hypothetical protein
MASLCTFAPLWRLVGPLRAYPLPLPLSPPPTTTSWISHLLCFSGGKFHLTASAYTFAAPRRSVAR